MNPCPWSIIRNLEAILKDSGTRNSLGYTAKGRSARANRVIDSVQQGQPTLLLYIQPYFTVGSSLAGCMGRPSRIGRSLCGRNVRSASYSAIFHR